MSLTVKDDIFSLLDQWIQSERDGVRFPVPFDLAWQMAGYSRKDSAKRYLPKHSQGILFHVCVEKSEGRPRKDVFLSVFPTSGNTN